jgi:dephospho-CoA kinase
MEDDFDAIIVVTVSEDQQRARMKLRDQLSDEEIHHRLGAQIPLAHKVAKATWVLENDGSFQDLEKATLALIQKIQSGIA